MEQDAEAATLQVIISLQHFLDITYENSPYLIPRGEKKNGQRGTKRTKTNSAEFQREQRAATGKRYWLTVALYI